MLTTASRLVSFRITISVWLVSGHEHALKYYIFRINAIIGALKINGD